ncbi:MAG TPA: SMP-30/gluconolactonase/LRE family protein [Niastella sp.]
MKNTLFIALLFSALVFSCSKDDDDDKKTIAKESYPLPGDTLFPEGIAYQESRGKFYTGSVTSGDILKVDVHTGDVRTFAMGSAQGRKAATGLKLDNRGRLWVCGGADNKVQVLDTDGTLLKSWNTQALFGSGFINDCIIDPDFVYFTDSRVKKIYRTSVKGDPGNLEEWLTFTDTQIPYTPTGTNANGIVTTPDNKYLIIVVTSSGKLYRIDKITKAIQEITLNSPVNSGDGLYLDNATLYVSRNATGLIFPVTLNGDYSQGTVGTGFGNNLLFNTTIAKAGKYFLVVNGQLNRRNSDVGPQLPFSVSRVTIP